MNKEKAIEKIQYAAMQVASVYACSAIGLWYNYHT